MKDKEKAQDIATQRAMLIAPLLSHGLDRGEAKLIKERICRETGLSERTIRRYLTDYKKNGFNGLIPKSKATQSSRVIAPEILDEAIRLRKEVPSRSVSEIIRILEWDGMVSPGSVKRSTLQENLQEKGFSGKHMAIYHSSGKLATRRFQKRSRNKLWHSDIKYGCYLPIGPNKKLQQVYLVAFLDDATRMILHAEFYPNLTQAIVEDCFRKSILKHGIPEAVYFDNGKQYKTKWMGRTCAKLGVRLMFAKPYSPEGTGKIERFNQNIDRFLDEYKVDKTPKTLEQMNERFWVWLEECYQNKPHSALGSKTPVEAYNLDPKPLKYLPVDVVANAFLHSEKRRVDKSGCISFASVKYEVGLAYVGRMVDVIFDPNYIETLTVEYQDDTPMVATKLLIGEKVGERPPLPDYLTAIKPSESRLLEAAKRKNDKRKDKVSTTAISFRNMRNGGNGNV